MVLLLYIFPLGIHNKIIQTRTGKIMYISVGCIFGELLAKEGMMQGEGELDQIDRIFKLLGVPTDEDWPGFSSLPNAGIFRWKNSSSDKLGSGETTLTERFSPNSPFVMSGLHGKTYLNRNGFNLLKKMLCLDPAKRISTREALSHPYFSEGNGDKKKAIMAMPHFAC